MRLKIWAPVLYVLHEISSRPQRTRCPVQMCHCSLGGIKYCCTLVIWVLEPPGSELVFLASQHTLLIFTWILEKQGIAGHAAHQDTPRPWRTDHAPHQTS